MKLIEKKYLLRLLRRDKRGFEMGRICHSIKKIKYTQSEEEILNYKLIRKLNL